MKLRILISEGAMMMKKGMLLFWTLLLWAALAAAAWADDSAVGGKLVAVTFDDGPGQYTNGLLDELAKRDVVVTFFVQGCNAERYGGVIKKAYEAGHQIASHTYNHPNLVKLSTEEVQKQLSRTRDILNQAIGVENNYMLRPPYGSYNAAVLAASGTPVILWSVDTLDWKTRRADAVYQHIVNDTRDGSIILMHDLYPTTVEGALRGIDYLREQGYELVTVSELLRRRGVTPADGSRYSNAYNNGQTLPGIAAPRIAVEYQAGRPIVSIAADEGAQIYYTLDGSRPDGQSQVYNGPFELAENATVRSFAAFSLNGGRSRLAEASLYHSPRGNLFTDIKPTAWCAEDVDQAVAAGLMTTEQGRFRPDDLLTRRDLATVLYRLAGSPPPEEQPPSKAAQAGADSAAVGWALQQQILTDATELDKPLTREQLAVILHRFGGGQAAPEALRQFADAGRVSPYAREGVSWAVAQGILTGVAADMLEPAGTTTRAELATIVLRCQAVWAGSFGQTVHETDLQQKGGHLMPALLCTWDFGKDNWATPIFGDNPGRQFLGTIRDDNACSWAFAVCG